jgi:putative ABC transport system substrate-binding protein
MGKGLELLREVVPNVTRVAVLWNPTNPGNTQQLRGAEAAAAASGVRLLPVEARAPAEIDGAFVAMARERVGALLSHGRALHDDGTDHGTRGKEPPARGIPA